MKTILGITACTIGLHAGHIIASTICVVIGIVLIIKDK
jgi:hypothetical protein